MEELVYLVGNVDFEWYIVFNFNIIWYIVYSKIEWFNIYFFLIMLRVMYKLFIGLIGICIWFLV